MDFDRVTISSNGKELLTLEPTLEEHDAPVGGSLLCKDLQGTAAIAIRAASAQFGGSSILLRDGGVQLVNAAGHFRVLIHTGDAFQNQDSGTIELRAGDRDTVVLGGGESGGLVLRNAGDKESVSLGGGETGDLYLRNQSGEFTVAIRAVENDAAGVWVGGKGQKGLLILRNAAGKDMVSLGGGETGDLYLRNQSGEFTVAIRAAENGVAGVWVGGKGEKGLLTLRNTAGEDTVSLGGGETGDLVLRDSKGEATVTLRAVENNVAGIWLGGKGVDGRIIVRNAAGTGTVRISGKAGDVVLKNADCAEEFEIAGDEVSPGTVMVIDEDGRLRASTGPYDTRVAGIVSGGRGLRPGIVLGHRPGGGRRLPIALAGRVACNVDAGPAPIAVGDLLTTSATPGHAMKVTHHGRAFGAVLGKALRARPAGRGAIPVLVALQ